MMEGHRESGMRIERGQKRVRAFLGGEVVADTARPALVWESSRYPTYYIPASDVRDDLLEAEREPVRSPGRGEGTSYSVGAGADSVRGAAIRYEQSPIEELRDLVRLDWSAMDAWFEEDEEVFTHPRDPYTRIDILPSSRSMRVEVEGTVVAETTKPTLLFETGHPVRYYLPRPHVRNDLLVPSQTLTHCPYKGEARHWSISCEHGSREDLAWSYPAPRPESARIAGLICFKEEASGVAIDVDPR